MPVVAGLDPPRRRDPSTTGAHGPALLRSRPKLVGGDFWNADHIDDPSRRIHTALLHERILIVERLCNLASLPPTGFRSFALPLRLVGGASIPFARSPRFPTEHVDRA